MFAFQHRWHPVLLTHLCALSALGERGGARDACHRRPRRHGPARHAGRQGHTENAHRLHGDWASRSGASPRLSGALGLAGNWGALPCDNPEKRPRSFAIPERVSEPNLANRPAHLHRHGAELRAQRGPPVGLPVASHGPRPRALSEVRAAHACRNGGRTHGERGARKRPPGECSPRCGAEAAWLANSHLYPTKGDRADRDSCDSLWPESRSFYRLTRAAHACPCGLPPQFRPSTALSFRPLAQESPATRPAPALATSSLTSRTARATARSLPPRAERRPTNSTKGSSTGCARLVKE